MKVKFYLLHAMEMELILIDNYAFLICFYATVMSKSSHVSGEAV